MTRGYLAAILPLALSMCAAPALAQVGSSVQAPAGWAPMEAPCVKQTNGTCVPVSASAPLPTAANGKQESFALVTGNTPAAAVTAYGGSYIVSQSCATYGTVTVRYRGPDGSTMTSMLTKTAADIGGGTQVTLGGGAVIDATITGTTGCNVSLVRVP